MTKFIKFDKKLFNLDCIAKFDIDLNFSLKRNKNPMYYIYMYDKDGYVYGEEFPFLPSGYDQEVDNTEEKHEESKKIAFENMLARFNELEKLLS